MIQPHGKRYGTLVFFSSMKILEILLLIKDIPTNIHHNIEKSQVLDNLHDFADLNLRSKHKRGQIHGYPSRVRVGSSWVFVFYQTPQPTDPSAKKIASLRG